MHPVARGLLACASLLFAAIASAATAPANPADTLTLTNTYDAFGKSAPGLVQDFGFSTLARYHGKTILFDTGTSAIKLKANAEALHIDLAQVDILILSHGHYDHTGGVDAVLEANPKLKIYAPADFMAFGAPLRFPFKEPDPTLGKTLPKSEQYFGGEKSIDGMTTVATNRFWKYDVEFVREAKEILPGLTLVPTTSTLMGGFNAYPPHDAEHPALQGLPELSAIFATDQGDVLISGCAHSGIEEIVQAAVKVRKHPIYMVAGGFHLIPYDSEYITALGNRLRDTYGVQVVAPAHCTGQTAFVLLRRIFGKQYRFFGLGETLVI